MSKSLNPSPTKEGGGYTGYELTQGEINIIKYNFGIFDSVHTGYIKPLDISFFLVSIYAAIYILNCYIDCGYVVDEEKKILLSEFLYGKEKIGNHDDIYIYIYRFTCMHKDRRAYKGVDSGR